MCNSAQYKIQTQRCSLEIFNSETRRSSLLNHYEALNEKFVLRVEYVTATATDIAIAISAAIANLNSNSNFNPNLN